MLAFPQLPVLAAAIGCMIAMPVAHTRAAEALDDEVVYVGCVESGGDNLPVATVLRSDGATVAGYYVMREAAGDVRGELRFEEALGEGRLRLRWQDRYGTGTLSITISRDQSSFAGRWFADGAEGGANWWGREGVLALLGSQKCEKGDAA